MRTRRLASAAVLAAILMLSGACGSENINKNTNINNFPKPGTVVASDTVTNATCQLTYSGYVLAPATNLLNMQINEVRDAEVRVDSLGRNCPQLYTFQWESTDYLRVAVNPVNDYTGRVRGVNVGTATIYAVARENLNFRIPIPASVVGGTGGQIIFSPSSITLNNCTGFQTTWPIAATLNGTAVTGNWASSNPTVATVNSTTGVVTILGNVGTADVTLQTSSGGSQTLRVTVNACPPTNTCVLVGFNPTVPDVSLTVGQQEQISPNYVTNPAGCGTVSYTASGAVTVSSTGLVTGVSPGTGTVTVRPSVGSPITLSFNVSANSVAIPGGNITLNNCTGFQTTFNRTVTVNGTAVTATSWTSSNIGVATVNSSGVITITGTAGTSTITANTASGPASITVTVTACPTQPITVTVTPETFSLIVGQQPLTFTCTVTGVPTGQSTGCTWDVVFAGTTQSAANCLALTPQGNGNTAIGNPIAGCTQQIHVIGRATANTAIFDTSVGNVSSGTVTCTITWNGTTTGTITVTRGQGTTAIASCTNQFGASFRPWGFTNVPTTFTVNGSSGVETINGVNYTVGPIFTLNGINAGSGTFTVQAAITDMTVIATRPVTVQ